LSTSLGFALHRAHVGRAIDAKLLGAVLSSVAIALRQMEQRAGCSLQANATARRPTIMLASLTLVTRCGLLRLMG
jgi:hypothetical protein